jgi:cystathionine gamma-lyase
VKPPASEACTSSAERRARWGGDAISEGFIRFSAGLESAEDLLADVAAALRASEPGVMHETSW